MADEGKRKRLTRGNVTVGLLTERIRVLKTETATLYFAARHPRTPWYAKLFVVAVVAYAFSPIDLIPDFIPILGLLDDLILLPVGIAIALKMVPHDVMEECRVQATRALLNTSRSGRIAAAIVILIWVALAALCIVWFYGGE